MRIGLPVLTIGGRYRDKYVFLYAGGAVFWKARKQRTVAHSSTESELIAADDAARQAVWVRALYADFGNDLNGPTVILAKPSTRASFQEFRRAASHLPQCTVLILGLSFQRLLKLSNVERGPVDKPRRVAFTISQAVHITERAKRLLALGR